MTDTTTNSQAAPLNWINQEAKGFRDLIDECVQCGFCLPSCPTYVLWGEEMDSPRGRIHLMKLLDEEKVDLTPTVVQHFDRCLGCMGCLTACPSGVQYDKLIEETRSRVETEYPRKPTDRLFRRFIFELFPHPERLRWLALLLLFYQRSGLPRLVERTGLMKRLPPRLADLYNLMPTITWRGLRRHIPEWVRARGERRARVGLLTGCVQRVFFSDVNAASVRVLAAEGCEVYTPKTQGCCGALALHAGREEAAREYARKLIDTFNKERLDYIAVNAAGCGSNMKEYGYLLRDDPTYAEKAAKFASRVRDINELLLEIGPRATRGRIDAKVAYHDACHLAHAQRIRSQPRALLESIPGIEIVPVAEQEVCCGSAGIYNLVEPDAAAELGERKARNVIATGASIVASANPGCTLQIETYARRLGKPVRVVHPVQLLDIAIRRPTTDGAKRQ
jgi:glycolate oxidase iron-sulfur subunit